MAADVDPDFVGVASSLVTLDDHGRAQVPSRPNERAPAIDFPGDVDTFQMWPYQKEDLTITVDGYRGRVPLCCCVYDNEGNYKFSVPNKNKDLFYRFTLHSEQHSGFYIAIQSTEDMATGEYSLTAHVDLHEF